MRPVSRRELIVGAAAVSALSTVGCSSDGSSPARTSPRPDAASRSRAVVIGAGFAGLTAALDLVEAGWDVVVLEARDRVGGRVHTLDSPFSDGINVEAGGESIDDDHADLLALVERFGLSTERRPEDKEERGVVFAGGTRRSTAAFVAEQDGVAATDYLRFEEALDALGEGIDPEHPERADRAAELDGTTVAAFLADQRLDPAAELLVRAELRGAYNSEPEDVSLLFVAQQSAVAADSEDAGVETMRIAGGNSSLLRAMAAELGERVRLSAPVTDVRWGTDGVRVTVEGGEVVDAARLVVATPFVPLRSVRFTPALPTDLADAVATVSLGPAAKVATEFTRRFWTGPDGEGTGFTVTDLPFGVAWESTDSSVDDPEAPGVLAQFITGAAAVDAAARAEADRLAHFGAQLDQVWPEGRDLRSGNAATVAWATEPFSGGGYAVWRPGQLTRFWSPIRAGVGPIRFAGEHTEALAGYMESAVRSGHRVAAELGAPPR